MSIRVNKYLSESGYCSRREADRLIEQGLVKINGLQVEKGTQVFDGDVVEVAGKVVHHDSEMVYLAFNKPLGITSTTDQSIPGNIIDFIGFPTRIFHVGRLDKDSQGLILMTNDGNIVNRILRTENHHEKEYVVEVDRPVNDSFLRAMSQGVPILETVTKPCVVEKTGSKVFKIILTEGLNRQIRRMCQYFDYHVVSLKRVRVMHITLDVPVGTYRHLTSDEKERLFEVLNS
ncbi:MAG: pseudouridine synthase [Acholeplasmataceae bacterium]|nr:pseudouridine synthase [Acholeplasmataceae bacterium]